MSRRDTVVRNFVHRYGVDGLQQLLDLLSAGESGQRIAERFQVSRERVRQWKNTFGRSYTLYQVHPDVLRVLDEHTGA